MEHRAVPPKVMNDVVAASPVLLQLREQVDAFALSTLHLHDMSDGVRPPEVGRINFQRGPTGRFRGRIVATLFVGETATGQDGAKARHVPTPFRKSLLDRGKHDLASAEPKIVEMGEPEGKHIHRIFGDDAVPDGQRAIEVARNPGIQCLYVSPFPCGRLRHHRAGARAASAATGTFANL